jgi:hypothetical protein
MRIIVTTSDVCPAFARYRAMTAHHFENYEAEYPVGSGATPLEAVADLLWKCDLEDDTPYCLEVRDR